MATFSQSKLPRLESAWYHSRAAVFWTHTIEHRATGWLSPEFHSRFREILLHTCARHSLACPAYVIMPDHWHLVWLGLCDDSDQLQATKFLREHVSATLQPVRLQPQAHDHVLRDEERKRGAFQSACHYIFENPPRAELSTDWTVWPYTGAMVSGYPQLDPRESDYWERFWRIHTKLTSPARGPERELGEVMPPKAD